MHRHNTKIMEDVEVCTACGRKVRQDGKDSTNKLIWKEECVPLKTYKKYLDLGHQPKRIEGRWNCGRCDRTGAPLRETRCNRKARVKRGNRKKSGVVKHFNAKQGQRDEDGGDEEPREAQGAEQVKHFTAKQGQREGGGGDEQTGEAQGAQTDRRLDRTTREQAIGQVRRPREGPQG